MKNEKNQLTRALSLANSGFSVIPLHSVENGQCTCGVRECRSPGKHPRTKNGLKDATNATEIVKGLFSKTQFNNIGVRTGKVEQLLVVDIDPRNNSEEGLSQLKQKYGITLSDPHVKTGSGGFHHYFKYPQDIDLKSLSNFLPGLDLKADGGYVVAPHSLHIQGEYVELRKLDINELPEPSPEFLKVLIELCGRKKDNPKMVITNQGGRNTTLTSEAGRLRSAGHEKDEIFEKLCDFNKKNCIPPLDNSEVYLIANSISRYPVGHHVEDSPYIVNPGEIILLKPGKDDEPIEKKIANFSAEIIEEEILDNGHDLLRTFVVAGIGQNGKILPKLRVPATHFSGLTWALLGWGPKLVIYQGNGNTDHVRVAIQLASKNIRTSVGYSYIGPKKLDDGSWVFLHNGGALSANGNDINVNVQMPRHLSPYRFEIDDTVPLKDDFDKVMAWFKLAPEHVAITLLSAAFRAPASEAVTSDFTMFLVGPTGTFKTELLALLLGFFGPEFNSRNLTSGFDSTEGSMEQTLARARGVIVGFDDFVPSGQSTSASILSQKFDKIARAQGNSSARQRLTSEIQFRSEVRPGGLPVMTGEDAPSGRSARARTTFVEIAKGDINKDVLTTLQKYSSDGAPNRIMTAYICWLLPLMNELKKQATEVKKEVREYMNEKAVHHRLTDNAASLFFGWELFLKFALENGYISELDATERRLQGLDSILNIVKQQAKFIEEEDIADRFISIIKSAFVSKRIHLVDSKSGDEPERSKQWGWGTSKGKAGRPVSLPCGEKIGWVNLNEREVILDPNLTFSIVQKLGRELGSPLEFSRHTVWKHLAEKKLIITSASEQRNLTKRTVEGDRKLTLVFPISSFELPDEEYFDEMPL